MILYIGIGGLKMNVNIITEGEPDGQGRSLFTATWIDPDNLTNRGQVFHCRLDEHVKDWQSQGWEVVVNRKESGK